MPLEIFYLKNKLGASNQTAEDIYHVRALGSPAQKIWSTPYTRDSSGQLRQNLIQQIAVSRGPGSLDLIIYYLWAMSDNPDSGDQIRRIDLSVGLNPTDDPGQPIHTYHPLKPSSGLPAEVAPVPDATGRYDESMHLKWAWIRDLQIRYLAGSEVIFFTGFFDEDDCMPGHPCQDPNHQPHETITEFTTIYYLDENRIAVPYHSIRGSELPLICRDGEDDPLHWSQWSGRFTFDDNDRLYVCNRKGPDRIYEIIGAGPNQVTGTPSAIFDFPGTIFSMACYGPGNLYFLGQDKDQGLALSKLDLISMSAENVHDSSQDPDFTNVVDFCILPPTLTRRKSLQVEWVQRALAKILGIGLHVDGNYGPGTRSAVKKFQKKHGLRPDGIVGPRTRAMILQIITATRG